MPVGPGDFDPPAGDEVGFNFKKPYTAPSGDEIGFNFRFVWYHPPAGNQIGFEFEGAYTPPIGNQIGFNLSNEDDEDEVEREDQYVFPGSAGAGEAYGVAWVYNKTTYIVPDGIGSTSAFGSHAVWNYETHVTPTGQAWTAWGLHTVWNKDQAVSPVGSSHTLWGTQYVWNKTQEITKAGGFSDFRLMPDHWVSLGTRRIYVTLGDTAKYGLAELSGGVRTVDLAGRSIVGTIWGSNTVWFKIRELRPLWTHGAGFGQTMVDFHHDVTVDSIYSTVFGLQEVHWPRDYIDLTNNRGIRAGEFGEARVSLWKQPVFPNGIRWWGAAAEQLGDRGKVELWERYVEQLHEVTVDDEGVFGPYTRIDNRNREVIPDGIASLRLGTPSIKNNARIIKTPMYVDMGVWGNNLVAYRIREFPFSGFDAGKIDRYTKVYNAAYQFKPASIADGAIGTTRVWFNRQDIKRAGGNLQTLFGQQWVSHGSRTLLHYLPPTPIALPHPRVSHSPLWVEPNVGVLTGWGVPTMWERFNIVDPKGENFARYSYDHVIRNWNPEVRKVSIGRTDEWGDTHIRTEWRNVYPEGKGASLFGVLWIRDRRLFISPYSPVQTKWGVAEVWKAQPDPPVPQTISGVAVPNGSGPNYAGWYGTPSLGWTSVWPMGEVYVRFGTSVVELVGARPQGIPPPYGDNGTQLGLPKVSGPQYIKAAGKISQEGYGKPRMSPHYIWAPRGYPYPVGGGREEYIDAMYAGNANDPTRPFFGRPVVTHRNRGLWPAGWAPNLPFGSHRASHNPQKALVSGFRAYKTGYAVLNGGGDVDAYGFDMAVFGQAKVESIWRGPQTVSVNGLAAGAIPATHRVEHFHRTLVTVGFDTFQISPPRPPSWPRQSHWVSLEYPPFPFQGIVQTLWGTAWVSNYIRYLEPTGEDSAVVAEYVPGQFDKRMRVFRRVYVQGVTAGYSEAVGSPEVDHGQRGVAAGSIWPGAVARPQVIGQAQVAPDGIDSAVFGDVQKWETGKVKPYGDDVAAYGRAIISQVLGATGFAGDVGTPSVSHAIGPSGIGGAMGDPVFVARWCGNRAVSVPGGADMATFGEAEITT